MTKTVTLAEFEGDVRRFSKIAEREPVEIAHGGGSGLVLLSAEESEALDLDAPRPAPVHPGEILSDWLSEAGVEPARLADELKVARGRIDDLLAGQRPVDAEMSLRLARRFGVSKGYWLRLQAAHDLEVAERSIGERILAEVAKG